MEVHQFNMKFGLLTIALKKVLISSGFCVTFHLKFYDRLAIYEISRCILVKTNVLTYQLQNI